MKKITTLFALALLSASAVQAQLFEETSYVGALSSDISKDWTKDWTNWNPQQTAYATADETSTLDGSTAGKKEITTTVTLDATKVYLLKGIILIKDGGKLVIPAGTLIRCAADINATPKNYGSIVVERGGKIEITGTSAKPVVFTSNKAVGARARGDWGGLVICGKTANNQSADNQVEGFNNVSFDATMAKGGGTVDDDNSGIIRYCRFEYGGLAFEANKEINGVTFNSVGNKTEVDYLQVSFSGDDSYEWFGGNVNCKHLIAYKGTDDDFDTDFGYRGGVQFGIGVKDTGLYDLTYAAPSGASTSEGFESDNDANGSAKTPLTSAVFSNMTMVGPVQIGSTWSALPSVQQNAFRRGARIRRNSRLTIVNSIFMGYRNFLFLDGDSSLKYSGALDSTWNNQMGFRNNLIVNSSSAFSPASATANGLVERTATAGATLLRIDGWLKAAAAGNNINPVAYTSKTVLEDPQNATAPDFRPVSASPALSGAAFTYQRLKDFGTFNSVATLGAINSYSIYPNPAKDNLIAQLDMNNTTDVVVYLYDATGKVVINAGTRTLTSGNNNFELSLNDVKDGIYLLSFESNEGRLVQRIVVNK